MAIRLRAAAIVLLALGGCAESRQLPDTDNSSTQQTGADLPGAKPGERPVSWPRLVPNMWSDQKRIWASPVRLVRGHHWLPVAAVVATTAVLIGTDPKTASYFRGSHSFHTFNSVFAGRATETATLLTPAALYLAGTIGRNSYARRTALLAGEAVADAEIVTTVMKDIGRRNRPAVYAAGADFGDSWFRSKGNWIRGNGSFPSGHTIAAFSVATVIARRYPRQRWIPYVAYSLSALVGFSRMTLSSHFASDVFLGGALGYSISRFVVLRQ